MLSLVLIAIVACLLLRYLIQHLVWKYRADAMTSNIASWTGIPILGHAHKFIGNSEFMLKRLRDITDIAEQNGGRFKVWMGSTLLIFTTVPEDIKVINNTFINKPFIYDFVELWMKNGIVSAPGVIWKKTIKRVHNAFSTSVTDGFQDIYNGYARKLVRLLKTEAGKEPFDASQKYISYVILESICHTVMGIKNINDKVVKKEYHAAISNAALLLMQRARNPLLYPSFIYEKTPSFKAYKESVKVIRSLSSWIVEKKRKEIEERRKLGITVPQGPSGLRSITLNELYTIMQRSNEATLEGKLQFMELEILNQYSEDHPLLADVKQKLSVIKHHFKKKWLAARKTKARFEKINANWLSDTICLPSAVDETGKPEFRSLLENLLELTFTDPTLTDQQVQADADNFIAAGFETTSVSIIFILIMIGSHPKVQEKLFQEIKEIFGDSKRDVIKEDQDRLKYTEAVVSETLRLWPVVPFVMRHADHDLKLGDWTIPQGAEVVVFPWGTCQSRLNWGDDAREFIPERWFRPNQPDPIAFNAFSYGRRVCIAKKSAMVFLKIIMVHCIRDLIIKSNLDELRVEMNVTLYPVPGPGKNIQVFNRE